MRSSSAVTLVVGASVLVVAWNNRAIFVLQKFEQVVLGIFVHFRVLKYN